MLLKPQKIVFSFALICCIALRIYLKLFSINPATGFYEGNLTAASIFNWVLIIGCIGLLLMGWLSSKKMAVPIFRSNPGMRVFSVLTGIFALVFAGSTLLEQVDGLLNLTYGSNIVSSLVLSAVGIFCLIVAPIVSGILFIVIGLKGCNGNQYHGALLLFPVLWQTALLLTTFMRYTLMRSASDQLLMIVTLLFIVPFLMANGRILSNLNPEKGMRQLSMFGLSFALAAVPHSIGILSAAFANKTVEIGPSLYAAGFYLCMGIYAMMMVFSLKKQ